MKKTLARLDLTQGLKKEESPMARVQKLCGPWNSGGVVLHPHSHLGETAV